MNETGKIEMDKTDKDHVSIYSNIIQIRHKKIGKISTETQDYLTEEEKDTAR